MDTYLTISNRPEAIYKDKGSKFFAFAYHVTSVEEVKNILEQVKKDYFDARHVCYAYILGPDKIVFRANDDGEPSGTAGRPILGQINSAGLTDILVIVVRYFGGILLGTSGLIQAYKTATSEVISSAEVEERIIERQFEVLFDYETQAHVMRIIKDFSLSMVSLQQELSCRAILAIRLSVIDAVRDKFSKFYNITFRPLEVSAEDEKRVEAEL